MQRKNLLTIVEFQERCWQVISFGFTWNESDKKKYHMSIKFKYFLNCLFLFLFDLKKKQIRKKLVPINLISESHKSILKSNEILVFYFAWNSTTGIVFTSDINEESIRIVNILIRKNHYQAFKWHVCGYVYK